MAYTLTFYLAFFLAFYLPSILTYFLAYILTFFLAFSLAFCLACVRVQACPANSRSRDMVLGSRHAVFGSRVAQLHPELVIWCWNLETLTWLGNKQLYTIFIFSTNLWVENCRFQEWLNHINQYKSYIQRPTNSAPSPPNRPRHRSPPNRRGERSPALRQGSGPVIDHRSYGSQWVPNCYPYP